MNKNISSIQKSNIAIVKSLKKPVFFVKKTALNYPEREKSMFQNTFVNVVLESLK